MSLSQLVQNSRLLPAPASHMLLNAYLWQVSRSALSHCLLSQHAPILIALNNGCYSSTEVLPRMLFQIRWDCIDHHAVCSCVPALLVLSTARELYLISVLPPLSQQFHPFQDLTPGLLSFPKSLEISRRDRTSELTLTSPLTLSPRFRLLKASELIAS